MKNITQQLQKRHREAANKSKFLLRHPLLVPVSSFIFLFFMGMVFLVALGGSTQGAADSHIVNVYVEGEKRTVTTRAKTVEDLIGRIDDIQLQEQDIVEPSRDALILEDDTSVNIYRARSVELQDGGRTITVFTAQRSPRLVAKDAGIDLLPEDDVEFMLSSDSTILESTTTEQIVINRSTEVQLNTYGALRSIRTTASTVQELLDDQGISPEENETVQPSTGSLVTPGLLISVNREGVQTEITEEDIAFTIESTDDNELQAGKTRIEREGVVGKRAIIYEIQQDNEGDELSRKEIQSVVLKKPVTQIIVKGTKIIAPRLNPGTTVAGDKAALMRAAGIAESDFGYVDSIISKESGWRPFVANSSSGAYGLCQSLPASKMASAGADYLTNPVTQLRWCSGYAQGRYGGWANAYNVWEVQRWW